MNYIKQTLAAVVATLLLIFMPAASAKMAMEPWVPPGQDPGKADPVPCESVEVVGKTTTYKDCSYTGDPYESAETIAEDFLKAYSEDLGFKNGANDLTLIDDEVRYGLASAHVPFQQHYTHPYLDELTLEPVSVSHSVYGTRVTVDLNRSNDVLKVRTTYFPVSQVLGSSVPQLSFEEAESIGLGGISTLCGFEPSSRLATTGDLKWFVLDGTETVMLTWDLLIFTGSPCLGDYSILIEAADGLILRQENLIAP